MQTQKIRITLDSKLIQEFRRTIPATSRSKFIIEAIKEKLSQKHNFKEELTTSLKLKRNV